MVAKKRASRQKRQNAPGRDGVILASKCTVGDKVTLMGLTWRLTAINDSYAILRDSDRIGAELRFVSPDTQFESREPYQPRVGGGGVDPVSGG